MTATANHPVLGLEREPHPIFLAAAEGDIAFIHRYLEDGNDVNISNIVAGRARSWTPLQVAVNAGQAEATHVLLEAGADPMARDDFWNTPLHWVIEGESAKALLAAGAAPNARNNLGETPMHSAECDDVIAALLEHGADINAQEYMGCTALHQTGDSAVVASLIAHGANVSAPDCEGYTPLDYMKEGSASYQLLREHGGKTKAELESENEGK